MILKAMRADAELRTIAARSAANPKAAGEGEESIMAEEQGEEEYPMEGDECVPPCANVPAVPSVIPVSWESGVEDVVGELEKTDSRIALELHETFMAADGGTPSSWEGYGSSQALAGGSQGSGHQKSALTEGMAVIEAIRSDKLPEPPATQPDPEPPTTQPEPPADQPPDRAPGADLNARVMHLRQMLAEKKLA